MRSLIPNDRNKRIDEIETILCNQRKCDVIGISETWLDVSINDSQVEIQGFQIFRKDRIRQGNRREAGGVAFYTRNSLPLR